MSQSCAAIALVGPSVSGMDEVLTDGALALMADIERKFGGRRRDVLVARREYQAWLDDGEKPDFLEYTADIRAGDWQVRATPEALQDRRVEITGPVERKMVINALNSGANAFMADFEDSTSPTWHNMIEGQVNLRDAVKGTIDYTNPKNGKAYSLNDKTAVLLVRPRGLHMEERHLLIDGKPMSAGFFDFVTFMCSSARKLVENGVGPYFYLPKLEHYEEAKLWSDVISFTEDALGLPRGTVRVTVLIETITAAFQMDEILHSLRDHIVGLNCGRWDYIFNFIKRFARQADFVLPERSEVGMDQHFLSSYSQLLVQTCHKRGAHAMGGMAAQIPVKNDEAANQAAFAKVMADKNREAGNGHDGTWVAHPALISVAKEIFDAAMPEANQLSNARADVSVTAEDLLRVPTGKITEAGLRNNVNVALLYLAAWLDGMGCVPIHNLMEDAATAEIARTQLWQWRIHGAKLDDGRTIDDAMITGLLEAELAALAAQTFPGKVRLADAAALLNCMILDDELEEFLTRPAYEMVLDYEQEVRAA